MTSENRMDDATGAIDSAQPGEGTTADADGNVAAAGADTAAAAPVPAAHAAAGAAPGRNTKSKPKSKAKPTEGNDAQGMPGPVDPVQPEAATNNSAAATRTPSKLDQLVILLGQPEGATLAELSAATGWQAHSVRGAMAGALRRKGYSVVSIRQGDGPRRYRIGEAS